MRPYYHLAVATLRLLCTLMIVGMGGCRESTSYVEFLQIERLEREAWEGLKLTRQSESEKLSDENQKDLARLTLEEQAALSEAKKRIHDEANAKLDEVKQKFDAKIAILSAAFEELAAGLHVKFDDPELTTMVNDGEPYSEIATRAATIMKERASQAKEENEAIVRRYEAMEREAKQEIETKFQMKRKELTSTYEANMAKLQSEMDAKIAELEARLERTNANIRRLAPK